MGSAGRAVNGIQEDDKLVAAQAGNGVAFPDALGQAVRRLFQQRVADGVAQRVVDELEAIEIEKQDGQPLSVALGGGNGLFQAVGEKNPVRQAGQRVVIRHKLDLLLQFFAFSDVFLDAHVVGDDAGFIFDRADGQLFVIHFAVFPPAHQFASPLAGLAQDGPHVFDAGRIDVRRKQLGRPFAHRFFFAVTGDGGKGRVGADDDVVGVGDDDAFRDAFQNFGRQPFFRLRLFQFRQVPGDGGVIFHLAAVSFVGDDDLMHGDTAAVAMQQDRFAAPDAGAGRRREHFFHHLAGHFRRMALGDAVVELRFRFIEAQHVPGGPVQVQGAALGVGDGNEIGRLFQDGQQPLLFFFPLTALADVAKHQDEALDVAGVGTDRSGAVVDGDFPAVFGQQRVVVQTDDGSLAQHFFHRRFHRLTGMFIDNAEHFGDVFAPGFRLRPAGQPFGHRVHEPDASMFVGGDDGVADAVQRGV